MIHYNAYAFLQQLNGKFNSRNLHKHLFIVTSIKTRFLLFKKCYRNLEIRVIFFTMPLSYLVLHLHSIPDTDPRLARGNFVSQRRPMSRVVAFCYVFLCFHFECRQHQGRLKIGWNGLYSITATQVTSCHVLSCFGTFSHFVTICHVCHP